MNKKFIVVFVVAGIIGYLVGVNFGNFGENNDPKLQTKLDQIKETFPQIADSNLISGQVEFVGDNFVKLSTPALNPFDEAPNSREIIVANSTIIVKSESKSLEVIKKEQEEYQKKMSSWKSGSSAPAPVLPTNFVEKEISISDIKVGDRLMVEASDHIRMVKEFVASKITVQAVIVPVN